ncbi:MAG: response regulator [Myxococcota bacterium]
MHRILIVDDEPHVTRLVQMKLRAAGYEAHTASNGLQALQTLEAEGPFHAVVTDYNMPKMDGRQLCEAIRERFEGEEIFIFLVTARLEQQLRDWADGHPCIEYIEKPISVRHLLERLDKCLGDAADGGE